MDKTRIYDEIKRVLDELDSKPSANFVLNPKLSQKTIAAIKKKGLYQQLSEIPPTISTTKRSWQVQDEDPILITTLRAVYEYLGDNFIYLNDWIVPAKYSIGFDFHSFYVRCVKNLVKLSISDIKRNNVRFACCRLIAFLGTYFHAYQRSSSDFSQAKKLATTNLRRIKKPEGLDKLLELHRLNLTTLGCDIFRPGLHQSGSDCLYELVSNRVIYYQLEHVFGSSERLFIQTPSTCIHYGEQTTTLAIKQLCLELVLAIENYTAAGKLIELDPESIRADTVSNVLEIAMQKGLQDTVAQCIEYLKIYEPAHPSIRQAAQYLDRNSRIHRLVGAGIDFFSINELTGEEFESMLIDQFNKQGYKAEHTAKSGDFGADILLTTPSETKIAIQCKRFKAKVNLKSVQEVIGALGHYACDYGLVITNSTFLNSAIKLAESNDIELWDGDALLKFLTGDLSFTELPEL